MKRFLLLLPLVVSLTVSTKAATGLSGVLFTNLNAQYFLLSLAGAPTNMVALTYLRAGTNLASINPTIGRVPYKGSATALADTAIEYVDANTVSVPEMDLGSMVVTNLTNGGPVISLTSGVVTNIPHGTGALTNDGAGNLGYYDYSIGKAANWVGSGTTNSTLAGTASTHSITATNQMGFVGYTTANLPTAIGVGYQTYCTDCLTPWGVGDRVEWDGASWLTLRSRLLATTTVYTYLTNCRSMALVLYTPRSDIGFSTVESGAGSIPVWGFPRSAVSSGTGASIFVTVVTALGSVVSFSPGTTTSGNNIAIGSDLSPMSAGDTYACGGSYYVSAVPDGTDNYWTVMGFASTSSSTYPVTGAFFLYDKYDANSHGQAYTNNWICVTGRASAYTFADSGLAVSTSSASPDRLDVVATTTAVTFYTNGVSCAVLNTAGTIPNTQLWANKLMHVKTLGTTTRTISEWAPWVNIRRATARQF